MSNNANKKPTEIENDDNLVTPEYVQQTVSDLEEAIKQFDKLPFEKPAKDKFLGEAKKVHQLGQKVVSVYNTLEEIKLLIIKPVRERISQESQRSIRIGATIAIISFVVGIVTQQVGSALNDRAQTIPVEDKFAAEDKPCPTQEELCISVPKKAAPPMLFTDANDSKYLVPIPQMTTG